MNILVIYDSAYGNTEKIARAIVAAVDQPDQVKLRLVAAVKPADLEAVNLIVVGSPTQGGKPTPAIQAFLNDLPTGSLSGIRVAAFDTRYAISGHGLALKLVMKVIGFAAPRIASQLIAKGGVTTVAPTGFIVSGKEGPLLPSELVRASTWMGEITQLK